MSERQIPTLYEWMGGMPAIERLLTAFYERVPNDPMLAPLFAQMSPEHAQHVAMFVAEVFGGPLAYSREYGGHPNMVRRHVGRSLTDAQRKRWMTLLLECADDVKIPDDPEFRSAFMAYVEWGTRLAMQNSQPGAEVPQEAPVPHWGWGEAPPYTP